MKAHDITKGPSVFTPTDKYIKTDFSKSPKQLAHSRVKRLTGAVQSFRRGFGALTVCALWLGAYLPLVHVRAQEACPPLTVTTTADSGVGSLRQAILDANACLDTNTIVFAPSAYGTITLTSGELLVTNSVNILGPGATNVALNGNASSRVFNVAAPGGMVVISGLTITNGVAIVGGGIYNDHSTLTVSNCTLTRNSALPGAGGGIVNDGAGSGGATLTLIGSSVSSNTASDGGGAIFSNGRFGSAVVTILDSTISANFGSFAGAIWSAGESSPSSASLTILNSTISSNSANVLSGGVLNDAANSGNSTLNIGSTILAGNSLTNIINSNGTVSSLGYNLSSDNASGLLTEPTDLTNTDPLLGPLQMNGGQTPTHALLCGSPAVNAGTNFTDLATDQRGAGYARTVSTATDIGAFELNVSRTFTVANTLDSGAGSLRQAILDANACPGKDVIVFDASAYGTITLTNGELLITDDLCILGPGPDNFAVDGNSPTTTNRVFEIGRGIEVTIAGIRITKGSVDRSLGGAADGKFIVVDRTGGGILNIDSSLVVSNCSVVGNSVGAKGNGAGICSLALNGPASLYVVNSTISSNSMGSSGIGGGIFSLALGSNATLTVLNSTLSHNAGDAPFSAGIGIACLGFADMSVQIVNSTLSSNSTPGGSIGGGVFSEAYAGTLLIQIMNSTLSDNSVGIDGTGGGIFNDALHGIATVQVVSTVLKAGAFGANFANLTRGAGRARIISLGFNLSSDDGGGYLDQSNDLLNMDPMLGPLRDNGGPTFTHALSRGSPAIDAGTNFALLATDQRGNGFPRIFGAGTDIGAFESQIYWWSGVLQPIHADGSSVFKVGSTVPVKFQLTGASAGINNALAKFSYVKLSSALAGGVNEPTSTTAPTTGNLFRYDPNTQQYVFNWSTKGLTIGAYRLQIDLGDCVSRSINVGLK